jgi:hypothetical protein
MEGCHELSWVVQGRGCQVPEGGRCTRFCTVAHLPALPHLPGTCSILCSPDPLGVPLLPRHHHSLGPIPLPSHSKLLGLSFSLTAQPSGSLHSGKHPLPLNRPHVLPAAT